MTQYVHVPNPPATVCADGDHYTFVPHVANTTDFAELEVANCTGFHPIRRWSDYERAFVDVGVGFFQPNVPCGVAFMASLGIWVVEAATSNVHDWEWTEYDTTTETSQTLTLNDGNSRVIVSGPSVLDITIRFTGAREYSSVFIQNDMAGASVVIGHASGGFPVQIRANGVGVTEDIVIPPGRSLFMAASSPNVYTVMIGAGTGEEGPAGPPGPPGEDGEDGQDGEKGDKGDQGDPGIGINVQGSDSWVNVEAIAAPDILDAWVLTDVTAGVGPPPDYGTLRVAAVDDVVTWTDNLEWVNVGPIKGEKGDQGDPGPEGPEGPAGADGVDGIDGAIGPEGPKGDTGPQGVQGPPGPTAVSTDADNQAVLGTDGLIYVPPGTGGGGGSYLDLTDTPNDYGNNDPGRFVKVNDTGDGLRHATWAGPEVTGSVTGQFRAGQGGANRGSFTVYYSVVDKVCTFSGFGTATGNWSVLDLSALTVGTMRVGTVSACVVNGVSLGEDSASSYGPIRAGVMDSSGTVFFNTDSTADNFQAGIGSVSGTYLVE